MEKKKKTIDIAVLNETMVFCSMKRRYIESFNLILFIVTLLTNGIDKSTSRNAKDSSRFKSFLSSIFLYDDLEYMGPKNGQKGPKEVLFFRGDDPSPRKNNLVNNPPSVR